MIVMPAIDVRGGKVVRLKQGQLQEETVYGSDPGAVARKWADEGARRLHVVDLDAAVSGRPQFDAIAAVIDAVDIPVEVGGGLRVLEIAMRYRDRGADRVVFGTAAIADPGVVQEAARLWPQSVAVALDARNGKVAVAGWKEITRVDAVELARRVKGWGVSRVQYTDVMRDGGRIIKRIRLGSDRFRMAHVPQDPLLLGPSQMTDFPNERVDDCQPGTEQLMVRQILDQFTGPLPGIFNPFGELPR